MVVGCGALGNEVLKNLALMGAEHIVVVEFEPVDFIFTPRCGTTKTQG